jgi:hypothetical protein
MWQYVAVLILVAAAGWYVFRRYRRALSGRGGGCACGGQEGCHAPAQSPRDLPPECRGCQPPPEGCDRS